jgi:hypothetical protein
MKKMTLEKIITKGNELEREQFLRLRWSFILHGLVFNLIQMGLMLMFATFVSDSDLQD